MLKISKKQLPLRAQLFQTGLREDPPKSIQVNFTGTLPDPRIDADAIDAHHAKRHLFSIGYHYIVRVDGVVELGRDPRRLTSQSRNHFYNQTALFIGVVGGRDVDGEQVQTTTAEQAAAIAGLEQAVADALGQPIEVFDLRSEWPASPNEQDPETNPDLVEDAEDELEATLDRSGQRSGRTMRGSQRPKETPNDHNYRYRPRPSGGVEQLRPDHTCTGQAPVVIT